MTRSCGFCGASIVHKRSDARYCAKSCYHRSADYKAAQKNYHKSPKGAAAQRRAVARVTEKQKNQRRQIRESRVCEMCGVGIGHRAARAKFCSACAPKSPAMKRAAAKYAKSAKGKAVKKRYHDSPKGQAARSRAIERRKQRMKTQEGDTDGTMAIAQDIGSESLSRPLDSPF